MHAWIPQLSLAVAICIFWLGSGLSAWRTVRTFHERDQTVVPKCIITGDQDMYGLGIRIGVYLQLLSTAFVDAFGTEYHAASLGPANLFFLFAFFIALLSTSQQTEFYAAEAYIIVSLGNGISWIMLNGTLRLNPAPLKEGGISAMFRFLAWGMWKAYTSFFWWQGINSPAQNECKALGWFFSAVELRGWFQGLHKALNIVEWLVWGVGVLPYPFAIVLLVFLLARKVTTAPVSRLRIGISYLFTPVGEIHNIIFGPVPDDAPQRSASLQGSYMSSRHRQVYEAFQIIQKDMRIVARNLQSNIDQTYGRCASGARDTQPAFRHFFWFRTALTDMSKRTFLNNFPFLIVFDLTTLLFTIITVELSIRLNHVRGVNYLLSSGQLIALIIGLGSCGIALTQFYAERLSRYQQRRLEEDGQWRVEEGHREMLLMKAEIQRLKLALASHNMHASRAGRTGTNSSAESAPF